MVTAKRSAIPNTYSTSKTILVDIQKHLVDAGALEVSFSYIQEGEQRGRANGVTFKIAIASRLLTYKMPVDIEATHAALQQQARQKRKYAAVPWEQAYQSAWATCRDMIRAQMAMVRIRAVNLEQVFLPYQLDASGAVTMYEVMRQEQFYLPTEKYIEGETTVLEDKS